ncbi:MAG TPA: hypothetical protein VGH52_00810 [Gaiellaceae bacterium]
METADTGFLGSPKNQKRILIGSALIFLVGLIVFVSMVLLRGTSNAFQSPISTTPASLAPKERNTKPTQTELSLARQFIETAVLRKNLDAIYPFVHTNLKGRLTRKQWDTGNIPVVGYPADNAATAGFVVQYSHQDEFLATVDLVAKHGSPSTVRPHLAFYLGLKKQAGKWLVSYWEPDWRPPVPLAPG